MARKPEVGISYFPLNSDIVHNQKIKLVISEFGPKAWAVIVPLFCKIYREKGYYIDWTDEDMKLLFAQDDCKCELSFVNEVAARCVKRGVFNEAVFNSFGVLTSDRIQENYLEAKRRSKEVELWSDLTLIDINVYTNAINVDGNPKNVTINPKKKRKENKPEESNDTHTPEELELWKQFQSWLLKHAPRVNQLKQPLTIVEYLKLRKEVHKDAFTKIILAMQNRADLLKKYVSAYLTILNWSQRENTGSGNGQHTEDNQRKMVV
jgi:hypothetical protein